MVLSDALKRMTLAEFRDFVVQSEHSDTLYELINGQLIEVPLGTTSNSQIGHLIAFAVHNFCRDHKLPCHTSGGDGAYDVNGDVVAPDFAYKPTPMSDEYPDPEAPL